jgi:hypothetical protein
MIEGTVIVFRENVGLEYGIVLLAWEQTCSVCSLLKYQFYYPCYPNSFSYVRSGDSWTSQCLLYETNAFIFVSI